jgi:hypothetical protein
MYFERCTAIYNMMVKLAYRANKKKTKSDKNPKTKNQTMFNLQMKFNELYKEIIDILSGKKGQVRLLLGGIAVFSIGKPQYIGSYYFCIG